jgi:hypothetical protein
VCRSIIAVCPENLKNSWIILVAISPDHYCVLCNLREPMDRNHLGKWEAEANRAECNGNWEVRTKMIES